MNLVNLGIFKTFYLLHVLVQLIECSDSPSPENKHVISSKPISPSSSSRQISPPRIWEDKHVIAEHVSINQAQRSSSISPSRISTNVHTHDTQQTALQATHHFEQHTGNEINENALPHTSTAPPTSPQSSHGSPIHQQDIRTRLRFSRRPRSPQENDSSRINERQSKHQKSRHKRANQRRF